MDIKEKSNKLSFRIWLSMNILVLLGIISLSSIYLFNESRHIEESLRTEGRTAASTLSSAIALSMLQEDFSAISPLAYSLLEQPNIQYVIVKDKDGTIVNQKGDTLTNNNLLIEQIPLIYFNSNLGEIEIALKADSLMIERRRIYTYTILLALFVSAITMIVSVLMSKKLSAPLNALMNAAKELIEGKRHINVKEEGTEEIKSLSIVFNQMATTIEKNEENLKREINNATSRLSEKVKTLKTLGNISQSVLTQYLNHQDIISIILKEIKAFINPDKISISLFTDDRDDKLEIYVLNNHDRIIIEEIHLNDSPIRLVKDMKQPVIRNDLSLLDLLPREKTLLKEGIHSTLMMPLIIHDRVIGTLNIGSYQKNQYSLNTYNQLTVFTNQIAIALDRVSAYESLQDSAYHDYLTKLPNYRYFKNNLDRAIDAANVSLEPTVLAVMFLDLDRFKVINDTLGHDFGDLLLKEVAKIILNSVNPDHTVARIGGDEFIVMLPRIKDGNEAILYAKKITEAINQPITINGYEVHITASMGIALYPVDGRDANTLIKHADTAMYRVKELGKNNYCVYSPIENDPSYEQLVFENELRKALERNEFTVYYQPKINIQSGKISGLEALVRWQHPEKGLISPGKFIPIAEETGLIIPIGEFVLRTACEKSVEWQKRGFPPFVVSVNLSTKQFLQRDLVKTVETILNETGLDPNLLELEITESMTMDVKQATSILEQLKGIGIQISVDDFGTGYSSLNYLRMLPIDRLKIDKSFINGITSNSENAAIVSTIINMAYNLKLHVIAEGVEEENQVLFLQKNNCDEIQGYYFSHPLPAEELEKKFPELENTAKTWSKINS
ncbi:EAL domain-containing protein [Calidifontibacillus oryziterrae]|uniref:EAL domain-containing protein n=1 Tax=Calidifontibacillus oryziterrae TaxID=1191699 RepID=UPI0002E9F3DF|nr:EAL domain-containing protein [Calidifontibacillus oryziterrae]